MAKIVRFNGNLQAFASAAPGTERTIFGSTSQANDLTSQINADFLRGWGIVGPSDQPTLEDFNGAMYTHGQLLAYLHQMGVAEYNASQEYHIGSMTQVGGIVYISTANNNVGNAPASSPAFWSSRISSGTLIAVRSFTVGGVYTPTAGTNSIIVRAVGGGGGGGGCSATAAAQTAIGGGGGSGSFVIHRLTAGFSGGVSMTIGAGGTAGVIGGMGGAGGATLFGGAITAPGGSGGNGGAAGAVPQVAVGGRGGNLPTSGNILNARGGDGLLGVSAQLASIVSGGGGASVFGSGGSQRTTTATAGEAGQSPGSGGSGASTGVSAAGAAGGAGATGIIIIEEYA